MLQSRLRWTYMSDASASDGIGLEVISPGGARQFVRVTESPFYIGRGGETKRHLQIADPRISRQCAAIIAEDGHYYLEDCGQRHGIFINGEKVARRLLDDGDVITFGFPDFYELIFRSSSSRDTTLLPDILSRMSHISTIEGSPGGLHKLNLLLEATTLLHSVLPLDAVLERHAGPRHRHHRRRPRPPAGDGFLRIAPGKPRSQPRRHSACARGGCSQPDGPAPGSGTTIERDHGGPRAGRPRLFRQRRALCCSGFAPSS